MRGCSFWLVVERDPIAFLKFRHGSQVNDEKIHRYTAHYRQPDSFHHHCSAVGKTAKIAIGITNIEDAKLHVALGGSRRSEEHTSELQSLMRLSYAVFCLKNNTILQHSTTITLH